MRVPVPYMRPRHFTVHVRIELVIGTDFHRAMVATAPGETLLTGHRRLRNWTRRMISSLFFVHEITFVLGKISKNCCHQSCTF